MSKLTIQQQTLVLSSLVEGNSIRSVERITGVHRDTIMRLMISAGERAQRIMDNDMMNLSCNYMQVDEIWTYVGKKQKNVRADQTYFSNGCKINNPYNNEFGDQYVFVAMDAETKLVPCFRIGKRTTDNTEAFIFDIKMRTNGRFQLSSDSLNTYLPAVKNAFKTKIDYGQIHKEYIDLGITEKRYSPAQLKKITVKTQIGNPNVFNISTSYVERQNLTMRMCMRRFTRLTNAFSKKLSNLKSAVSLHFFYYNYMRSHKTLKMTPCEAAKITKGAVTWERFLNVEIVSKAA